MQLPESLSHQSVIIQLLNTVGLGLLGLGLAVLYRALISRSKLLSESLDEMKSAYQSVLELMDRRASLIDKRFEDEKAFRSFYLSFFEDSDVHFQRSKRWKEDEVTHLQGEVAKLSEELNVLKENVKRLILENRELKQKVDSYEIDHKALMLQNQELRPDPPPNVRGLH